MSDRGFWDSFKEAKALAKSEQRRAGSKLAVRRGIIPPRSTHGAEENQEQRLDLADNALTQRNHHNLDSAVLLRISRAEPRADGIQFRLRLLLGDAWSKAADHGHPTETAARRQILLNMQRDPDFRVTSRRKLKFAGKNADDADAVGVQPDGTPYDVRVATETAYSQIQGTKPQSLGYGLNDSPAGLAAWIVEKFRTWSDSGGDVEKRFSKGIVVRPPEILENLDIALEAQRSELPLAHNDEPLGVETVRVRIQITERWKLYAVVTDV